MGRCSKPEAIAASQREGRGMTQQVVRDGSGDGELPVRKRGGRYRGSWALTMEGIVDVVLRRSTKRARSRSGNGSTTERGAGIWRQWMTEDGRLPGSRFNREALQK